jgi:hypothetical protein
MNRIFGLILLLLGGGLLYFAWQANETLMAEDAARGFTDGYTAKPLLLLGGGLVALSLGIYAIFRNTVHH